LIPRIVVVPDELADAQLELAGGIVLQQDAGGWIARPPKATFPAPGGVDKGRSYFPLLIRKSSFFFPALTAAAIQRGMAPRPAQV
jgi:hypothetical protein